MSKIPTVPEPHIAFQNLITLYTATTPEYREAKVKPHLRTFLSHPIIKELLEEKRDPPSPQDIPPTSPVLKVIQASLTELTKAVEDLKKVTANSHKTVAPKPSKQRTTAPTTPSPRTYSAIARSRPPNPSLVVDLAKYGMDKDSRVKPEIMCQAINKKLAAISPPQVQLAAVRWTAKGNLVITGGPAATPHTLQTAAPHISSIIPSIIPSKITSPLPQPRANVKWSKILLNGVPTGASKDRAPYTPDECHTALAETNPSYSPLSIMQKPSWVRPPSSYTQDAISSLSVAFEDPDGTKLKALLADRYLYAFGTRIAVKKWKYRQKSPKDKSQKNTALHPTGRDDDGESEVNDEEDIEITLTPMPRPRPPVQSPPTSNPATRGSNRKQKHRAL